MAWGADHALLYDLAELDRELAFYDDFERALRPHDQRALGLLDVTIPGGKRSGAFPLDWALYPPVNLET